MSSNPQRPLPQPTADTQPYWDAARKSQLLLQRCNACGRYQFYPRPYCVKCLADISWVPSEGRGRIYTYTVVHRPPSPALERRIPYTVVVVDLDEGVRMLANLVEGVPAVGARVRVTFEKISDDVTLPQFRVDA